MNKVAVLADIHGNIQALESVVNRINDEYPEIKYVLAGDYVDYGANPNEVIRMIRMLPILRSDSGEPIAILGNHDKAVLDEDCSRFRTTHGRSSFEWTKSHIDDDNKLWISRLRSNAVVGKLCITHGSYDNLWKNIFPKDEDNLNELVSQCNSKIIVVAHSHLQFMTTYSDSLIINPGSVGQSRNGIPKAHYAIINLDTHEVELGSVEYDISASANSIINNQLPKFNALRLYLGI